MPETDVLDYRDRPPTNYVVTRLELGAETVSELSTWVRDVTSTGARDAASARIRDAASDRATDDPGIDVPLAEVCFRPRAQLNGTAEKPVDRVLEDLLEQDAVAVGHDLERILVEELPSLAFPVGSIRHLWAARRRRLRTASSSGVRRRRRELRRA